MKIIITLLFFLIGCTLGSFFHVVGYRLPKGESLLKPKRSYCPNCHHQLQGKDLVPVLSYLFSFGKCRYCKRPISVSYPILELLTGTLFSLSFHLFGLSYQLLNALILSSLFSIILVSDLEYLMIPDEITGVGAVLFILVSLIENGWLSTLYSLGNGLFAFFFMYFLMLIGNWLFKKESLGGADIKLMFLVGFLLGPISSLIVIFLSSIIALPIAIILYQISKEHVIAFGPFIMISLILLYFFQVNPILLLQTIFSIK